MNRMNKSEVYSWRLTSKLKEELEQAARAEKVSLSVVLELLTRDWLRQRKEQDESEQKRLRAALMACAGSYKGDGTSATNAEVRRVMGQQLMKKYRASQRRAPRQSD
jgi:hypothetical protein